MKSSVNNGSFFLQKGFPDDIGNGSIAYGGGPRASIVSFASFPKGYAALLVPGQFDVSHGYLRIWEGSSWSSSNISLPVSGAYWASMHENELDVITYNSTRLLDSIYNYSSGQLTYSWINDDSYIGSGSVVYSNSSIYFISPDSSTQSIFVYQRLLNQSTWSEVSTMALSVGTNQEWGFTTTSEIISLQGEVGILFVSGLNPYFQVEYTFLEFG